MVIPAVSKEPHPFEIGTGRPGAASVNVQRVAGGELAHPAKRCRVRAVGVAQLEILCQGLMIDLDVDGRQLSKNLD